MRAFLSRQRRRLTWMMRPRRAVGVAEFDAHRNRWVDAETAHAAQRDELTLATFNVWLSDYCAAARYQAIADLLEAHTPDVIALQEVTSAALDLFLAQPWARQHYHCAAATGRDFGSYG